MLKPIAPFTSEIVTGYVLGDALLTYLDKAIDSWRERRTLSMEPLDERELRMCTNYVDAYQSVRASVFGEVKP